MMRSIVPMNSPRYASILCSPFLERSSGCHVTRRREVALHLVVELEQRDGESGHLERGHVVTDVGHPPHLNALAIQHLGDVGVGDVELHEGRAAHAVDHDGDLGAAEIHGIAQDPGQELVHYLVGWLYLLALDAWLAVDADPDLHLIVADVEDWFAALRRDAARQSHPHRAH